MNTEEFKNLEMNVAIALDNATDNGYDFDGWTAEAIVDDLVMYDVDFENYDMQDVFLRNAVENWMQKQ